MIEIKSCEVCDNNDLISAIDLGLHPMCDDLKEINSNDLCANYPIDILLCSKCITAHQRYQVPKSTLFPSSYHYRAKFTSDVLNGMKSLVEDLTDTNVHLSKKFVLDIGCNDGSLLNFFSKKGYITVGVEPTNAGDDAIKNKHKVYKSFFSTEIATKIKSDMGHPSIITFTNVFAHIENLKEVLNALNILMDENTLLVIENHYLGSIIENKQFDTFYHEHPRTYSATSFTYIAKSLGCKIQKINFPSRYGGNIRVSLTKSQNQESCKENDVQQILDNEVDFSKKIMDLNPQMNTWIKNKKSLLNELYKKYGPLHAKAFPGRAAILIKLLEIDSDMIFAVYEKPGSIKINHYVPGTRIPIISDEKLYLIDNKTPIINLAWHIPNEIKAYLKGMRISNPLINIVSKEDFED